MKPINLNKVKKTLKMTDYPVCLVVEAIARCNLRCPACPYSRMKRNKGIMSENLYKKIVEEIAEKSPIKTHLWFAFMGEPTILGKKLFEMINYAKEKGIKHACLNTNATFINDEMTDWLIQSGLDQIFVSIDAFSEETYNKIRVGGDYQKVAASVLKLLEKIRKQELTKPEVIVQFIVMEENKREEGAFKDYWLKRGAVVKIRRKLSWGGSVEAENLDIPQFKRDMPCPWLMRQMVIMWDGRVAQCDGDYEGKYSAGDINRQTIWEVWNGELKRRRERHLKGDFDFMPCKKCNDWQVGLSEFHYPDK